ncbi:MAG: hypothetical protein IPN70_03565 [Candidatus Moraniibacteriota bacterium]|nr:MAG: hypothetical protein IPN70_03565 [Candidatus Moranbacteria bacterium]
MEDIIGSLPSFSEFLTGDVVLFLVVIGGAIALSIIFGKSRFVRFVLSIYLAYAFLAVFPKSILIKIPYGEALIFLGALILLVFLGKNLFNIYYRSEIQGWIPTFFFAFFVSGFLLGIFFRLLPGDAFFWDFLSYRSAQYLIGEWTFLIWFIAPLIILTILNTRKS